MYDQRYAEDGYAFGTDPNTFLKDSVPQLKLPKHASCLMLAEGEGRNGVFMAECGYSVTGVDISEVGLKKAKDLAKRRGVELTTQVADLAEYDIGESKWDCIVGIFCHLPVPIRERVLGAIPEALRPGGYVLFETYTPDQLEYKTGGPPSADMMYSSDIFRAAFEGKLVIERNEEIVRHVVEGKYHTGDAAVVQLLARKPDH